MMNVSPQLGEFWNLFRVESEVARKKSYIYAAEAQGKFPKRIKIGRSSVWSSAQVESWKRAHADGREWRFDDA